MNRRGFLGVLAVATLLKLLLALTTYGSNDVRLYELFAERAVQPQPVLLYEQNVVHMRSTGKPHYEPFWHPPFLLTFLAALKHTSTATGIPFQVLFRLLSILADIGSSLLVWRMVPGWPAAIYAASPVLLFLSGFHGNTDSLMLLCLVLCAYWLESGRPAWWAGLAFGLSFSIKLWPAFVFLPLALTRKSWRERMMFSVSGGLMFVALGMPYLAQAPGLVIRKTLSYRSLYGQWGVSELLSWLPWPDAGQAFEQYGRSLVLAACLGTALWLYRQAPEAGVLPRVGLVAAVFLALTPGFGIQYLSWLLPWVSSLGAELALLYSLAGGFFMFVVYTFWSGGLRWYYADSTVTGTWRESAVWQEMVAWLAVVYVGWAFARKMGLFAAVRKASPLVSVKRK